MNYEFVNPHTNVRAILRIESIACAQWDPTSTLVMVRFLGWQEPEQLYCSSIEEAERVYAELLTLV